MNAIKTNPETIPANQLPAITPENDAEVGFTTVPANTDLRQGFFYRKGFVTSVAIIGLN